MNAADIDAAIARGVEAARNADKLEEARADIEAAVRKVLPIIGVKGTVCLVTGAQMGAVQRWLKDQGRAHG